MKKLIRLSTALMIVLLFNSFSSQMGAQNPQNNISDEQQVSKKYTCTMHPEVVMDKPGKCPKCGMTLVVKKGIKKGGMHNMHNMQDSTKMKCDTTKMKKCC